MAAPAGAAGGAAINSGGGGSPGGPAGGSGQFTGGNGVSREQHASNDRSGASSDDAQRAARMQKLMEMVSPQAQHEFPKAGSRTSKGSLLRAAALSLNPFSTTLYTQYRCCARPSCSSAALRRLCLLPRCNVYAPCPRTAWHAARVVAYHRALGIRPVQQHR